MDDYEVHSRWREEIRQWVFQAPGRKRFSVRIDDIIQATGVTLPSRAEALFLWRDLWDQLKAEGLVLPHLSDQEDGFADRVILTPKGMHPDNW